ncbi:MAG: DUF5717 family protein [Eubacteriales bacterium]|nr:DUF5717 family protein [Eubacteriales bacterium]
MKTVIQKILDENIRFSPMTLVIDGVRLSQLDAHQWLGSFSVSETQGERFYTRISSDSFRIVPLKRSCFGRNETVEFMIDTEGLETEDGVLGHILLHNAAGEQAVEIRLPQPMADTRPAVNQLSLEEFVRLAKKSFREAFRIFVSSRFTKILQQDAPQLLALYQGYMIPPIEYQNMEDFLVEAKLKERIVPEVIFPEQTEFTVNGQEVASIVIRKQVWGYCQYRLSTDASWLSLEKNMVSGDDFIGSQCVVSFYIDSRRMRSGKCPAHIFVTGQNVSQEYRLTACVRPLHEAVVAKLQAQKLELQWVRSLLEYRARGTAHSLRDCAALASKLRIISPKNLLYALMDIQVLVEEGDQEEAKSRLKSLLEQVQADQVGVTPLFRMWYLYLTAVVETSTNYRKEVLHSLDLLVQENGKDSFGLYLLLSLRKDLENSSIANLQQIQEQYRSGKANAFLYLMAYELLQQFPSLINQLDAFTVQVLWTACRLSVMTEAMVQHVTAILSFAGYSDLLYRLVCRLQKDFDSDVLLQSACTWLIKNGKIGPAYFSWYEKAVERDIRLTRLYEYYVDSIEGGRSMQLPKMVRLYFSYNTSLGYKKKAMIYRNIVMAKEEEPGSRLEQAFDIEEFVKDQLLSQRISEDLGFLYDRFLNNINMNKRMAQNMSEMLFVQRLELPDKAIRSIEVIYPQLKRSFHYGVDRGVAYPAICRPDAVVIGLDEQGRKWHIPVPEQPQYLLTNRNFIHLCRAKGAVQLLLSLHLVYDENELTVDEDRIPLLIDLLQSKDVHKQEQRRIERALVAYWHQNAQVSQIRHTNKSLMPTEEQLAVVGMERFVKADVKRFIEVLLIARAYEEAFDFLHHYDYHGIEPKLLLWLFNDRLHHHAEDSLLAELALYLLRCKIYHGPLLGYLAQHGGLSLTQLQEIYEKMQSFLLDTYDIEEQLLTELLLQCRPIAEHHALLESYAAQQGKPQLIAACLTRLSYELVFYDQGASEQWLSFYHRLYERHGCVNKLFGLGYLKLMASLTADQTADADGQWEMAVELLRMFEAEDIYLTYFGPLRRLMGLSALHDDEYRVEYFDDRSVMVTLETEDENGVRLHPMKQVYPGIFSESLTLFYDDAIKYRFVITRQQTAASDRNAKAEQTKQTKQTGEWQSVSGKRLGQSDGTSRFALINQMMGQEERFENADLVYAMGRFIKNERFLAENFSIE